MNTNSDSQMVVMENGYSVMPRNLEMKHTPTIQWTDAQVKTICNTVAKGATDDELKMFLHLSQTYGLDPFAREIWFVKMKERLTIMTSRDGYLKIANNHPDFEGIVSDVVYENDVFKKTPDGVDHQYGIKSRGKIVGAYALVYRRGIRFPIYVFAPFNDYNKGNEIWRTYPHAMNLKVAESMALKRAFSLSGLVSHEELDIDDTNAGANTNTKLPANAGTAPAKNGHESTDTGISIKAKQIFEEYLALEGDANHAKNAIYKITGGRSVNELTQEDIDALHLDLSRRKYEAEQFADAYGDLGFPSVFPPADDPMYSDAYEPPSRQSAQAPSPARANGAAQILCADCGASITNAEQGYSMNKFGRQLCRKCQTAAR